MRACKSYNVMMKRARNFLKVFNLPTHFFPDSRSRWARSFAHEVLAFRLRFCPDERDDADDNSSNNKDRHDIEVTVIVNDGHQVTLPLFTCSEKVNCREEKQ